MASSTDTADLYGSGTIAQVKRSCLESLQHSGIQINDQGITEFLTNLDKSDWDRSYDQHGFRFPLNYKDELDELNFLSVLTLMNFLSAYRVPLHDKTGQGAYDTIRRFMMTCYIMQEDHSESGRAPPLSARGMAELDESTVARYLNLPLMVERDHPTLPAKIGERDPEAVEIVGLVQKVMNESGRILLERGAADLGSFIADFLNSKTRDMTPDQRADALVQEFVTTFPAFKDEGLVKGHLVKVYKKAQLLTYFIGVAFKDRPSAPFPLPGINQIPACVDNVLPTMAVYYKMIDLSSCVYPVYGGGLGEASESRKEGVRQNAEEAFAIRAATLAACERVAQLAPVVAKEKGKDWLSSITAMDVDGYLWAGAKVGKLRNLPRLSERGTVFY